METTYRAKLEGAHKRTLDSSSHVHIPAKYLEILRENSIDSLLIKKEQKGSRKFLVLYPINRDEAEDFSTTIRIYNSGKTIIPKAFVEYAGIKRKVIFYADQDEDRIELWAAEEKEAELQENAFRYGDFRELRRLGIEKGKIRVPKEIWALLQREKSVRSSA